MACDVSIFHTHAFLVIIHSVLIESYSDLHIFRYHDGLVGPYGDSRIFWYHVVLVNLHINLILPAMNYWISRDMLFWLYGCVDYSYTYALHDAPFEARIGVVTYSICITFPQVLGIQVYTYNAYTTLHSHGYVIWPQFGVINYM